MASGTSNLNSLPTGFSPMRARSNQTAGNASYCTPPTVKRTVSGDGWVMAEIDVQGGKIKHFINGEQVLEFDNPKYDSTNAVAKKFIIGGNDKVSEGYISLQSNSHPMDFRKIEIMEY